MNDYIYQSITCSMHKVVGGVLSYGLISVVIQVQGLFGLDVSQSSENQPADSSVTELHGSHVLQGGSILVRVIYSGNEDCDVSKLTRGDV
jgi:hypothetical protein